MNRPQPHREHDVVARIVTYSAGRDRQLLERKYTALRESPFRFFRGTAHLFWEDWSRNGPAFYEGPAAWCCGDLHLENFGTFRGDNRLVYFDINDFDEAALAPATRDPARFLCSLWLAAETLNLSSAEISKLARLFLEVYTQCLLDGKARWLERATSRGVVKDLLQAAKRQARVTLLDARTERQGKSRRIVLDGTHALPMREGERLVVAAALSAVGATAPDPEFFEMVDVARRVAGTGSLGVNRYLALIRGNGGADGEFLLDLKQAIPSTLAAHGSVVQPHWITEAFRVVQIQSRMQAAAPALLRPLQIGAHPYLLRELQPTENRLSLAHLARKDQRIRNAVIAMAQLVAWAQLRSSGRQSSAAADDLLVFAESKHWRPNLLRYAQSYSRTVVNDWRAWRASSSDRR